jgi:hypothetical protein
MLTRGGDHGTLSSDSLVESNRGRELSDVEESMIKPGGSSLELSDVEDSMIKPGGSSLESSELSYCGLRKWEAVAKSKDVKTGRTSST